MLTVLRMSRVLERIDAGVSPQQYRMLKLIGGGGERSARLAEKLAVAKPTLTSTADSLVAAGLAVRQAEPGDRRVVRLCLTPAGQAAIERADAAYAAWFGSLLDHTGAPRPDPGRPRDARRGDDRAAPGPASRRCRDGAAMRPGIRKRQRRPAGQRAKPAAARTSARPRTGLATLGSGYGEGWLRRLAAYCWRHKTLTLVAFGASLLATLVTTAIPLIQRDIIDNAILAHNQAVWPGATLLIVAALVSFGASTCAGTAAASCPSTCSTTCGPSCSAR